MVDVENWPNLIEEASVFLGKDAVDIHNTVERTHSANSLKDCVLPFCRDEALFELHDRIHNCLHA